MDEEDYAEDNRDTMTARANTTPHLHFSQTICLTAVVQPVAAALAESPVGVIAPADPDEADPLVLDCRTTPS